MGAARQSVEVHMELIYLFRFGPSPACPQEPRTRPFSLLHCSLLLVCRRYHTLARQNKPHSGPCGNLGHNEGSTVCEGCRSLFDAATSETVTSTLCRSTAGTVDSCSIAPLALNAVECRLVMRCLDRFAVDALTFFVSCSFV